jgi:hypothetical protein
MKIWLTALLIVVLGLAAWYVFRTYAPEQEPEVVVEQTVPEPVAPEPEVVVEPEPEPEVVVERVTPQVPELAELPLPPLPESDPLATEELASLVGEAEVVRYFVNEDIIARAVANIDALDSQQVPAPIQVLRGPQDSFVAIENPDPETVILNEVGDPIPQYLSDPANDQRYTPYVEMLEAVDTETLIEMYRRNYPLFEQAYGQLGFPEGDFDDRLKAVIDELLATPEVERPVRYIKPEAFYLFADEDLESLPAGQKIMIRMGSENAARVKSRLREIREAL